MSQDLHATGVITGDPGCGCPSQTQRPWTDSGCDESAGRYCHRGLPETLHLNIPMVQGGASRGKVVFPGSHVRTQGGGSGAHSLPQWFSESFHL